jgi:methylthioribose-1-phosphate isomerase
MANCTTKFSAFWLTENKPLAIPKSIEWVGGRDGFLRLIDQTQLPSELAFRDCQTVENVWEAIKSLRVRGAPAIGIAAAYGVVIGVRNGSRLSEVADYLRTSRPTAVNLFWALDRMERVGRELPADSCLLDEARAIHEEDRRMCHAIGRAGAALIGEGSGVLTHCNTGGLATAEYGTALSVLFTAANQGRRFHVFADETRPLLQGARLTTWELQQAGIDVTLICDSMAAQVMKEGRVQLVIVGADRIAANGDAANKIGTYGVAVLAKAHGIPFYVAAPSSTFDLNLPNGDGIPIEQRDPREVTHGFGRQTAPDGVAVYNPAFDVTPARLIAGLITEKGVIQPVTETAIHERLGAEFAHR